MNNSDPNGHLHTDGPFGDSHGGSDGGGGEAVGSLGNGEADPGNAADGAIARSRNNRQMVDELDARYASKSIHERMRGSNYVGPEMGGAYGISNIGSAGMRTRRGEIFKGKPAARRGLKGQKKSKSRKSKRPAFGMLKDHFNRHGKDLGVKNAKSYYEQAVKHMRIGRKFVFRHKRTQRRAHVTRLGKDSFMFTSSSLSGNRIYTHMVIEMRDLRVSMGITLPKGF